MKKQSNWSLVGYVIGFVIALLSAVRWFVVYPDYSQAFSFIFSGLVIMALSWIYNELQKLKNTVQAVEDWMAEK